MFLITIIGAPTFRSNLWGGKHPDSCLLRNSVGNVLLLFSSRGVSTETYDFIVPGAILIMALLMLSTVVFGGSSILVWPREQGPEMLICLDKLFRLVIESVDALKHVSVQHSLGYHLTDHYRGIRGTQPTL